MRDCHKLILYLFTFSFESLTENQAIQASCAEVLQKRCGAREGERESVGLKILNVVLLVDRSAAV